MAFGGVSLLLSYAAGHIGGYWGGILGMFAGVLGLGAMFYVASSAYADGVEDVINNNVDKDWQE